MKGPRPKPTRLKELAGNPGKRPLNKHEARLAPEIPPCPSHVLGEARREWKLVAPLLFKAGFLTAIDRAALAGYCLAWALGVKATKMIAKQGEVVRGVNGTLKQNPWVSIRKNANEEMRKFLIEFGMTPSSRSRVHASEMEQMSLADLLFSETKARD